MRALCRLSRATAPAAAPKQAAVRVPAALAARARRAPRRTAAGGAEAAAAGPGGGGAGPAASDPVYEPERDESTASGRTDRPDVRLKLLEAALDEVPALGWTQAAVAEAAGKMGLSRAAHGVLPRGPVEVVDHFMDRSLAELGRRMGDGSELLRDMRTVDRLKAAVRMRLKMQADLVASGRWGEAMALGALPQNLPHTLHRLALLMDEIWHVAGDTATDISWYTKRGVLGGVYTATELYMLTDKSPGFADTWLFLDRRLEDVSTLGRLPSELQTAVGAVAEFVFRAGARR